MERIPPSRLFTDRSLGDSLGHSLRSSRVVCQVLSALGPGEEYALPCHQFLRPPLVQCHYASPMPLEPPKGAHRISNHVNNLFAEGGRSLSENPTLRMADSNFRTGDLNLRMEKGRVVGWLGPTDSQEIWNGS